MVKTFYRRVIKNAKRVRSLFSIAVFIHELLVGHGESLERFVHRFFGGEESGAEVQSSLLLPETASRHQHDTRLVQNLFDKSGRRS